MIIMGSRMQGGVDLTGVAYCLIGAVALTVATLMVRGATTGGNLLMIVGLQMLVGSVCLALVSLLTEEIQFNPSWRLAAAFAYTTLAPGLLATWIWFALVQRVGAIRAATFHFLNPFFGVAIAAVILSEKLGVLDMLGVAIVTLGILLVQISKHSNTSK
jgi:drug/metabolite transporter (DMT)-like permease